MCVLSVSTFVIESCRGLFQVIAKSASRQCSRCYSLHIPIFFFVSSAQVHHRSKGFTQFVTRPNVHNQFRELSVSVCLHIKRKPDSRDVSSSCGGVWDPCSVEDKTLQNCEAVVVMDRGWLGSDICTIFRCNNFIDTEISVLYSFL